MSPSPLPPRAEAGGSVADAGIIPCLVIASTPGGGIGRHVSLVRRAIPVDVQQLDSTPGFTRKLRTTAALLHGSRADRIVTHGLSAAAAVRLRPRSTRSLVHIEFWHGDPFFDDAARRRAWLAARRVGRRPDVQVFVSRWLAEAYADPGTDVRILPIAIPDLRTEDALAQDAAASTESVYLGRWSHEKGVAELDMAWPRAVARASANWRLRLFSDTGLPAGAPAHASMIVGGELKGEASVHAVLQQAPFVVIPSRTETGPYVALEAMRAGRPFVGTEVGDMPDFVEGSGCGWLVPPRNPLALEEALVAAMAAEPERRSTLGGAGRAWLLAHRPFEVWVERARELYLGTAVERPR